MFREGRHAQKKSAAVKACIVFSIDLSLIFRQKLMQSRLKSLKIGFVHRNRRKSTFGKSFFSKKSFFVDFGITLGPWGPPGTSREPPRIVIFLKNFQWRLKMTSDVPREAAASSRGSPPDISRILFWVVFSIDVACQKTSTKCHHLQQPNSYLPRRDERRFLNSNAEYLYCTSILNIRTKH